jgi:regulator of chromosome condensation
VVRAVSVDAGIDNAIAITSDGEVYAWGFSANYRTGLETEDTVTVPTLIKNSEICKTKVATGACSGQFLLLAGPSSITIEVYI